MRSLVVYDSKFGNTAQLAEAIAAMLHESGTVEVGPVERIGTGWLGEVDLLVVGGPTQAHGVSPEMRTWLAALAGHDLAGLPVLAFDTRYRKPAWLTGSAARRIAARLRAAGAALQGGPVSFFVVASEGPLEAGELDRALAWVRVEVAPLLASRPPAAAVAR